MRTGRTLSFLAAMLGLFALDSTAEATPRNVRVATYNVQQMPPPWANDGHYFDEDGTPISDVDRLALTIDNILASDYEVVALNEVFDEDARATLVAALEPDFPFFIAYIGNDTDTQDSGLMLFSKHPFVEMQLDDEHVYECGDVEIGFAGTHSECPERLLGFTEFHCDGTYANDPIWDQVDCYTSKGAGLVEIMLPTGDPMFVAFSHFVASYESDSKSVQLAKISDRRKALEAIGRLVTDGSEENALPAPPGDLTDHLVVVMGDLNIDGNAFHDQELAEANAEWGDAFGGDQSTVQFTSCGELPLQTCLDQERSMVDPWAFDTSKDDLGRTNGFPFTLDLTDASTRSAGERLDYILYRGPSASQPGNVDMMIPQHAHIAWSLAGAAGLLSDHLPLGLDILLPIRRTTPSHSTPRTAQAITMVNPDDANPPNVPMQIQAPGHMQWVHLDVPPGTYTVRTLGGSVGFDLYAPEDLSRPIPIRHEAIRGGMVYVLDQPPYFMRTFVAGTDADGNRIHNREATAGYQVQVTRHRCTSPDQACILVAGGEGLPVTWPALPVNAADTLWFEFLADQSDQASPPIHEFSALRVSGANLPAFAFSVVDMSQHPVGGLTWTDRVATAAERTKRVRGLTGGAGTPSFQSLLFKLRRTDPMYTGKMKVAETTNLTYFVPQSLRVVQENDDSAHDELALFSGINPDLFYQSVTEKNVHEHANLFTHLPPIDELEDGGTPWPAGKTIGSWRLTGEFPLVLAEDDDEDNDVEQGDWMLALPAPANAFARANGFAVGTLPLDISHREVDWTWTDDPSQSDPDDTSYQYKLNFRLSHVPPCLVWQNVACK